MPPAHLATQGAFGWWLLDLQLDPAAPDADDPYDSRASEALQLYVQAELLERDSPSHYGEAIAVYAQVVELIRGQSQSEEGVSQKPNKGRKAKGQAQKKAHECLDLERDGWSGAPAGLPLGIVLANALNNSAGLLQAQGGRANRERALALYQEGYEAWPLNR